MPEIVVSSRKLSFRNFLFYPDVHLEAGTLAFIHGPSGSGKSTYLKLCNQTLTQSEGEIYFMGQNTAEMDTLLLRRRLLLVGQALYLFRGTLRQSFHELWQRRGLVALEDEELRRYLKIAQADFALDTVSDTMSGGERQRIYIAQALSLQAQVLMLDEPTSALDEQTAQALLQALQALCRETGISLLIVSHNMKLAERYADQLISFAEVKRL